MRPRKMRSPAHVHRDFRVFADRDLHFARITTVAAFVIERRLRRFEAAEQKAVALFTITDLNSLIEELTDLSSRDLTSFRTRARITRLIDREFFCAHQEIRQFAERLIGVL